MCNRVFLLFGKLSPWNLHVNSHVNGTTFQSGLRFQTGLISLRVSCKHVLTVSGCYNTYVKLFTFLNNKILLTCVENNELWSIMGKQKILGWKSTFLLDKIDSFILIGYVAWLADIYGIRLSHIFVILSISYQKPSISIEIQGITNQKFWDTRFFTPWIWNTRYFERST